MKGGRLLHMGNLTEVTEAPADAYPIAFAMLLPEGTLGTTGPENTLKHWQRTCWSTTKSHKCCGTC